MLAKLSFALAAGLLLSGCCEAFGVCTSVRIHTSITPSYEVAQEGQNNYVVPQQDPTNPAVTTPFSEPEPQTLAAMDSAASILR
jgi:hypothetical protein